MTQGSGSATPALPVHWRWIEDWFTRRYGIVPLDGRPGCLFAFNLFRHGGGAVVLPGGETLKPGDLAMEIHFRRAALLPLAAAESPVALGIGLLRLADRETPRLADRLASDPALADVRALHAVTLFHRGITRYGFDARPLASDLQARWLTWWQLRLLFRDHPAATSLRESIRAHPEAWKVREVWASRAAFCERYGKATPV